MKVEVKDNDVNGALKKLKKKMFNEGIIKELMARRFYEKPCDKRNRKRREAIRRTKKDQARRKEELGF